MSITKEQLDEYIRAYSIGKPIISDEEYDMLLEEYINEHGESSRPFLRSKQSAEVNEIVGTLPKVYGVITPMREGQKTYQKWVTTKKINEETPIVIQPKFDGCSISLDCKTGRFFTRGDYDNGESVDVTDLFRPYFNMDLDESIDAIKFEAIVSHEVFEQLRPTRNDGSPYLRARDFVAAIITSRNIEMAKFVTLVPLREYVDNEQMISSSLRDISIVSATVGDTDIIQQFIDDKLHDGAVVEYIGMHYSIDGVVVSVMNGGYTIPDNEVAIKILNDIQETKIINIQYQYGKTGKITPVGILEPVKFNNITVDHVGLSTLDRVASLNLKFGDTVRIVYNIVPYLLDSYHDGTIPIPIPTKCPICQAPLNMMTLKTVRCTNPYCTGLQIGMIIRYCEQMKMMGLSKGIITKLFENGLIKTIADLYELTPERIQELDGFKEKSANNICKTIHDASTDVPISRWLGALPIKDVSAKKWQLILDAVLGKDQFKASNAIKYYFTLDKPDEFLEELILNPSWSILQIGSSTTQRIREGLTLYWDTIKMITPYISFRITTDMTKSKGRIVLSGTRDAELIKCLNDRGYETDDKWSKPMAVVIPYVGYTSRKVDKAKKYNVPVYTIEEAYGALI